MFIGRKIIKYAQILLSPDRTATPAIPCIALRDKTYTEKIKHREKKHLQK